MSKIKSFADWIDEGVEAGYCSPVYCDQHDGYHGSDSKLMSRIWELSDGDHCNPVVRIKSGDLESQIEYYEEEAKRESLIEPVEDFL